MQVEAIRSKRITVDIDPWVVKDIVIKQYCEVFNLPQDAYIRSGTVMEDVEQHGGSHSWFDEKILRKATEEDKAAVLILQKLQQEL